MAYLTKEAYEGKERFAERRMMENAEIETLTEEQHDALSWLCTIRHDMHGNQEAFFLDESGSHEKYWDYIEHGINDRLIAAKLPKIEFKYTIEDYNTDGIVLDELREEYGDSRYNECEEEANAKFEEARQKMISLAGSFNSEIERYLREIDEEHGTKYCPGGHTRLY